MRTLRPLLIGMIVVLLFEHAPIRLGMLTATANYYAPVSLYRMPRGSEDFWRAQDLEQRLRRYGWDVQYVPGLVEGMNAYGVTWGARRLIQVDAGLAWDARYVALAHEAGHAMQPPRLSENQGEVFAVGVAVALRAGDVRDHGRYLANLRGDLLTLVMYWREIYAAADTLRP